MQRGSGYGRRSEPADKQVPAKGSKLGRRKKEKINKKTDIYSKGAKKMKRKTLALILSVCFAVSLTACGTEQKDTQSEAVQTVSTASVSSRQEASKDIEWSVASSSSSSSSEQEPSEGTKGSETNGKHADMSRAKMSLALRLSDSDPIMTNAFFADDYTLDDMAGGYYCLVMDDTDATEKVREGDVLLLTGANDGYTKSGGVAIKITADNGSDGNGFVTFTGEHFLDGKYDKLADDSTAILQSVPAN